MTPAERVIEKCGGEAAVAKMAGVDVSRVHRWRYPRSRGGTDGIIPSKHQQPLLEKARAQGIDLTPADFFDAPAEIQAASADTLNKPPAPEQQPQTVVDGELVAAGLAITAGTVSEPEPPLGPVPAGKLPLRYRVRSRSSSSVPRQSRGTS